MSPNQVDEMFRLLTTVVSTVQRIEQEQTEMRAEFDEFREETRENFNKLSGQERIEVRKVKMLNDEVLETKAKVEDLIERVEKIEEKQAA